jgi:hypothetical protein
MADKQWPQPVRCQQTICLTTAAYDQAIFICSARTWYRIAQVSPEAQLMKLDVTNQAVPKPQQDLIKDSKKRAWHMVYMWQVYMYHISYDVYEMIYSCLLNFTSVVLRHYFVIIDGIRRGTTRSLLLLSSELLGQCWFPMAVIIDGIRRGTTRSLLLLSSELLGQCWFPMATSVCQCAVHCCRTKRRYVSCYGQRRSTYSFIENRLEKAYSESHEATRRRSSRYIYVYITSAKGNIRRRQSQHGSIPAGRDTRNPCP